MGWVFLKANGIKKRQKTHPSAQYKAHDPSQLTFNTWSIVSFFIYSLKVSDQTSVMFIFKRKNQLYIRYGFPIGSIPIMLKIKNCTLFGKSQSEMAKANECPNDCGMDASSLKEMRK